MKCIAWLQGTSWECQHKGECDDGDSSNLGDRAPGNAIGDFTGRSENSVSNSLGAEPDEPEIRTYKDDSALRDQQSTGRKRAAKAYPLTEGAPCEWSMQANCGGGEHPIVGCHDGKQQARHHGPDKNTLNNEQGNVHRICHSCHNRWHTLNDDGYVWGNVYPLHNPESCGIETIALNEVFWDGRKTVKAKD